MAGEYGIDRQIFLPDLPDIEDRRTREHFRRLQEAVAAAYDELAKRMNEFSYEVHWGAETPAQITAGQNNYQLGEAVVHRLSTDASRTITGFVAPLIERMDLIINVGAQDLVIANQSGSSSAANRVITVSGADTTLGANGTMMLWYDLTTARYREIVA